ncbi:MAG: TonB-dependent receptor plug domain-containing protein [Saprospiraceae bacterium]
MKTIRLFLYLMVLMAGLAVASCGTTGKTSQLGDVNDKASQSLADVLRKNSTLQITGSGDNIKISVRGAGSFSLNTEPLYVVDGVPMGNSYARANNAVNPAQIVSIRVLKSQSETTIYGEDGNHGVILIKTQNGGK